MRRLLLAAALFLLASAVGAAGGPRVIDASGQGVAGARVRLFIPPASRLALSAADTELFDTVSNAQGWIDRALPSIEGAVLVIDHPDFMPRIERLETAGVASARQGFTLELDAGEALAVRVRGSATGATAERRITGGNVCARWSITAEALRRSFDFVRCSQLEASQATVRGLASETVELRIQAAGFLPQSRMVKAADMVKPGAAIYVDLEPGLLLSGQIVDSAGQPVAGATLAAGSGALAASDAGGRFALAVGALPASLSARAAGFRERSMVIREREGSSTLRVELGRDEQLLGRAVDRRGEPVAGASIWLERTLGADASQINEVDTELDSATGSFAVVLPAAGTYRLVLRAEGFQDGQSERVEVVTGEHLDLGPIELDGGARIEGRLVDPSERAVLGAVLRAVPPGLGLLRAALRGGVVRATSNAQGDFTLGGLDAGRYRLEIRHAEHATRSLDVELSAGELLRVGTIELGPGVHLAGSVVDLEGMPRAGVRVALFAGATSSLEPSFETMTDGDGRFDDLEVPSGRYRVRVESDRLLLQQRIDVPEAERHTLELVAAGTRLEGWVIQRGAPVAGGEIRLASARDPGHRRGKTFVHTRGNLQPGVTAVGLAETTLAAELDTDGRFEMRDAPTGLLIAEYISPTGQLATRRVRVPAKARSQVRIELGGVDLIGEVLDARDRGGIAATIEVRSDSGRKLATVRSDHQGRFLIEEVDPEAHLALRASAPGYATAMLTDIVAGAGQPPPELLLERGGDGRIEVALRYRDGRPASGVSVNLLDESGATLRALRTDTSGRRVFDSVPAGRYWLVWSDSAAGTGVSQRLVLESDEPLIVEHVLDRGIALALACHALACAGEPLEAVAVYGIDGLEIGAFLPAMSTAMRFSAQGRLELGRLSPGRYLVRTVRAGQLADRTVTLDHADLTLDLPD